MLRPKKERKIEFTTTKSYLSTLRGSTLREYPKEGLKGSTLKSTLRGSTLREYPKEGIKGKLVIFKNNVFASQNLRYFHETLSLFLCSLIDDKQIQHPQRCRDLPGKLYIQFL